MKKLLIILIALLSMSIMAGAYGEPAADVSDTSQNDLPEAFLRSNNLYERVQGKKFMLYRVGDLEFFWSIILRDSLEYSIILGSPCPGRQIGDLVPFDTVGLVKSKHSIIEWGMDTLQSLYKSMTPIEGTYGLVIYRRFEVFDEDGRRICDFRLSGIKNFAGLDSANFNNKFDELRSFMYQLALSRSISYDRMNSPEKSKGKKKKKSKH